MAKSFRVNQIILSGLVLTATNVVTSGQTGQYAPSGMTGQFITTAQTGQFYPAVGNPSNFLTSVTTMGVTSLNVSGNTISGAVTITGVAGIGVSLSGNAVIFSGVSNQTGQFVTTAMTGVFVAQGVTGNAFYPRFGNPAGYSTSAGGGGGVNQLIATGSPISGNITISGAGGISIRTGDAGLNVIAISGWDTGQYLTTNWSGQASFGGTVRAQDYRGLGVSKSRVDITTLRLNFSDADTLDWSGRWLLDAQNTPIPVISIDWGKRLAIDFNTGTAIDWSGRALSGVWSAQHLLISGSSVVIASQTGQFISTSSTGVFVTRGETGNAFYPRFGNPAGYSTSAGGSVAGVTGINVSGSIPITGLVSFSGASGISVSISGQNILIGINTSNLTIVSGIGGTQVMTSGNFMLISGGASNQRLTMQLPIQSVKLPNVSGGYGAARLDAGNYNWELLFNGTGSSIQTGMYQFFTPIEYIASPPPTLLMNTTLKTSQSGLGTGLLLSYLVRVGTFHYSGGSVNVPIFDTPNTGTITINSGQIANTMLTVAIPLLSNSGMQSGDLTFIQISRVTGITTVYASGDSAIVALALQYTRGA